MLNLNSFLAISAGNARGQSTPPPETPANQIKAPLLHTDFHRTQKLTSSKKKKKKKKTIQNRPWINPEMLALYSINLFTNKISIPCPLWPGELAPDRVLSMGQIKLNCVLMLYWIAWNGTVSTFKLRTYAKLNCLKYNCFYTLNWIAGNRTVFNILNCTYTKWIVWNRTVLTFNCV